MRVGARVADRFEIECHVASGGMGIVYRALDLATGALVAIKFLRAGADRRRFEREARLLATLEHPAIVRHLAHGEAGVLGWPSLGDHAADELTFLAMEWLEGEDLEQRLTRGPLG